MIQPKKCASDARRKVAASEVKTSCVHHALLLLRGKLTDKHLGDNCDPTELLSHFLLDDYEALPDHFLHSLILTAHEKGYLSEVMGPPLQKLAQKVQKSSLANDDYKQPLTLLADLCDIKTLGAIRPICSLITQLPDWLPDPVSKASGRELQRTSFLGPFLQFSVFATDDPKVASKYFPEGKSWSDHVQLTRTTLRVALQHVRTEMFKIVHSLLVSSDARDPCLDYLATLLNRNAKKTQIQADGKLLATDGFMINIVSVLQQLCLKVRPEKVDRAYLVHPRCRIDDSQVSTIKATKEEIDAWKND